MFLLLFSFCFEGRIGAGEARAQARPLCRLCCCGRGLAAPLVSRERGG